MFSNELIFDGIFRHNYLMHIGKNKFYRASQALMP